MQKYSLVLGMAALLCLPAAAQKTPTFTPPFADDASKEWCYLEKSTTDIGMPFQPDVTLVTYDGSLYTKSAELNFFYGADSKPLFARQKTYLKGWIPIVTYDWRDKGIAYSIEMFAAPLKEGEVSNNVNFVRVTVKNENKTAAATCFSVATRGTLNDYRHDFNFARRNFDAQAVCEMTADEVLRGGKLIYTFPNATQRYAVDGEKYDSPFRLADKKVDIGTLCGIVRYERRLAPGKSYALVFKMPRVPVPVSDKATVAAIKAADYDTFRASTIAFWQKMVGEKPTFVIPEKRIDDGYKASLVHVMLATRTLPSGRTQTDGVPYPMFFLTSAPQMLLAYLGNGNFEKARMIVDRALTQQEPSGLYFDRSLAHGGIIPTAHGHVMYALCNYYLYTRDKAYAEHIFPSLTRAVQYIRDAITADKYGLLPPTYQYDNEMIDGHYACNNYWALLGLRFAIRLAVDLHKDSTLVADWKALELQYRTNILKGIEASVKPDGYVTTGLYAFTTGKNTLRKFDEFRSDCDWENMLLAYPTEILPADHRYVKGTLDHVRKGYAEGVMTYRHGLHLHQYITANMIEQYMAVGDTKQALTDFYHLVLHGGSTHEGFENMVESWKDRMVAANCPPPHAWASAKLSVLTRNFMLYEYGGTAGLEPSQRSLYLFPVMSPEWIKTGDKLEINDAPCEMGRVTASMTVRKDGADISYSPRYTEQPGTVRVRIPYFKTLVSFDSDDRTARLEDGCIVLQPGFTRLSLKWKDNPEPQRNMFGQLLEAYRACDVFVDVDKDFRQILRPGKAFLRDNEKTDKVQTLNFDLVKRAFLYEFDRRHREGEVPPRTNAVLK